MLVRELYQKQAELDEANKELGSLMEAPKSALEELVDFKARVIRHGVSRTDVVWFNLSYTSDTVNPIELDSVHDTPTQVGLSNVLTHIEAALACIKNPK